LDDSMIDQDPNDLNSQGSPMLVDWLFVDGTEKANK